jgi:hypothetical protein
MWWGLFVVGMALAAFALETIEQRWLNWKVGRDLGLLRTRMHAGDVWDTHRGSWRA